MIIAGIGAGLFIVIGFILRFTGIAIIEHLAVRWLLPKKYPPEQPDGIPDGIDPSKRILLVDVNMTPPNHMASDNIHFQKFKLVVAVDYVKNIYWFIINDITNDTTTKFNYDDFDRHLDELITISIKKQ